MIQVEYVCSEMNIFSPSLKTSMLDATGEDTPDGVGQRFEGGIENPLL